MRRKRPKKKLQKRLKKKRRRAKLLLPKPLPKPRQRQFRHRKKRQVGRNVRKRHLAVPPRHRRHRRGGQASRKQIARRHARATSHGGVIENLRSAKPWTKLMALKKSASAVWRR